MIVRPSANHANFMLAENLGHSCSVFQNLLGVFFKSRSHDFPESHSFCRDGMHMRTALNSGENRFVNFFGNFFIVASKNNAAARTAESFMSSGSNNVKTIVKRIAQNTRRNQP